MLTIFRESTDFARSSPELPRDVIWIDLLKSDEGGDDLREVADEGPYSIDPDAE